MSQIIRRSVYAAVALLFAIPVLIEMMAAVGINRDRVTAYRICTLNENHIDCGFHFIKVSKRDVQISSSEPRVGQKLGCLLTMEQTPITSIPLAIAKHSVRCTLSVGSVQILANPGIPGFVFIAFRTPSP